MSRKKWIVIGVAVVVGLLGYGGYRVWRGFQARQAALQAPAEETAIVRRDTLRVTVNANGSLAPQSEVALAFVSGGRVAEVLVAEGDEVEAGQPLVRLETDDLELQVTQAEISLRQAELKLEAVREPPDPADVERAQNAVDEAAAALRLAQINYDGARDSRVVNEALQDAQSAYDQALNDYNHWLNEYNENGADYWFVEDAQEKLDDAQLALDRAQQQADQQLQAASNDLARTADAYRQAQNDLDALLSGADARDVESAQLQVEQARLSLEQARLRLEQATLTAPLRGTVTAVNVQAGGMAGGGQSAVLLSVLDPLKVTLNLDETDVAQVAVGTEATVIVDAFPDVELTGVVTSIAPVANVQSGVVLYPVEVSLAPTDLPVRAGMTAEVEIIIATRENVLIVPLRAVQSANGRTFVLRQVTDGGTARMGPEGSRGEGVPPEGGRTGERGALLQQMTAAGFEPVSVTLGMMTDTEVEVTGGLEDGDVVSVVAVPSSSGQRAQRIPGMFFGGGR